MGVLLVAIACGVRRRTTYGTVKQFLCYISRVLEVRIAFLDIANTSASATAMRVETYKLEVCLLFELKSNYVYG